MTAIGKVLYVQYADPRVYPPVERGAELFRTRGWDVSFLGVAAEGQSAGLGPGRDPAVELMRHSASGVRAALSYLRFWLRALKLARKQKADIVYCSDPLSYPAGLLVSFLTPAITVFHEHDTPSSANSAIARFLRWARRNFARRADERVLPQRERAARFESELGVTATIVHNCPSPGEIGPPPRSRRQDGLTFWHHGSLNPQRFPPAIIEALRYLPDDVRLEIAGYETHSSIGFMDSLLARASDIGLSERIVFHGAMPRESLFERASRADIGIVLFERAFAEPMVGASVKPFDYLARGLPLLTNDTVDWIEFYIARGVGLSCNPDDAEDIARAMRQFYYDPAGRLAMAERGYALVRSEWNYPVQFGPLVDSLERRLHARREPGRA